MIPVMEDCYCKHGCHATNTCDYFAMNEEGDRLYCLCLACRCQDCMDRRSMKIRSPEMTGRHAKILRHSKVKPAAILIYTSDGVADWWQLPEFHRAYQSLSDTASLSRVDVLENPSILRTFQVTKLPTVVIYSCGREVKRLVGVHSMEDICAHIQDAVKSMRGGSR